jgi:hypothetical protein
MHRQAIAKRAKAFISGKMSSQDAHKALDNFWKSVDDTDEQKNHPAHHTTPPAVPTGVERHAQKSSRQTFSKVLAPVTLRSKCTRALTSENFCRPRRVLNHP